MSAGVHYFFDVETMENPTKKAYQNANNSPKIGEHSQEHSTTLDKTGSCNSS